MCYYWGLRFTQDIHTIIWTKKKKFNGSVYETFNNKCVIKFSVLNIIQIPIRSDPIRILFSNTTYLLKKKKQYYLALLLIPFRSGWKISYQSLNRNESPSCSTLDQIPVHSGLIQPFQLVSVHFDLYINFGQY